MERREGQVALESRPYPNEHACRLRDPDDFQANSFRRVDRDHEGKRYSVIIGRLKGETTTTEQAFRYPKETWAASQARKHCQDHDGSFEAASQDSLEIRSLPLELASLEIRQEGDGQPTSISWYAALFDQLSDDLGGFRERIGRRAFSETLRQHDVRALVNHDPNLILARTGKDSLKLHVDHVGLHAETLLPDTSYAQDLVANIRNGNIAGGSFMFLTQKDSWTREKVGEESDGAETLVRTVQEVARLYDVSLVSFPAYPQTEGTAALRSLERMYLAQRERIFPRHLGILRRRLELLQRR